jgi:hypothetical protein
VEQQLSRVSKATKVVGTRRFSVNAYDFNAYDKDSE